MINLERSRIEHQRDRELGTLIVTLATGTGLFLLAFCNANKPIAPASALGAVGFYLFASDAKKEYRRARESVRALEGAESQAIRLSIAEGLSESLNSLKAIGQPIPAKPLEEFDLAGAIASYPLHILIASASGSGKTSTLFAAMHKVPASSQFWIFDPKNSPEFKTLPNYLWVKDKDAVTQMILKLQEVEQELNVRQELGQTDPPIFILCDEFNSILAECDGSKSKPESQYSILLTLLKKIVNQGRSANIHVWLGAQSPLVEDIGFNTSIRDSLAIIAQARNGKFTSISKALKSNDIIPDEDDRLRLREQFEFFKANSSTSPIPIAYCGLDEPSLVKLPNYSNYKDSVPPCFQATSTAVLPACNRPEVTHQLQRLQAQAVTDQLKPVTNWELGVTSVTNTEDDRPNTPKTADELLKLPEHRSKSNRERGMLVYAAIMALKNDGWSDSKIVKDFLNRKGRNYDEGKELLLKILQLGSSGA